MMTTAKAMTDSAVKIVAEAVAKFIPSLDSSFLPCHSSTLTLFKHGNKEFQKQQVWTGKYKSGQKAKTSLC